MRHHTIKQHRALHGFSARIERCAPNAAGTFWIIYVALGLVVALVVLL